MRAGRVEGIAGVRTAREATLQHCKEVCTHTHVRTHARTHTHTPPYQHSWFKEGHVESDAKGNHQQNGEEDHLDEDLEDVNKHHDVDPNKRELADEDYQVDPGQEDGHNANLPLPALFTATLGGEDPGKDDGEHEERDLQPVDPVQHVEYQAELDHLEGFHHQADHCEYDDQHGSPVHEARSVITQHWRGSN